MQRSLRNENDFILDDEAIALIEELNIDYVDS